MLLESSYKNKIMDVILYSSNLQLIEKNNYILIENEWQKWKLKDIWFEAHQK